MNWCPPVSLGLLGLFWLTSATPGAFSQEKSPKLDLAVKLINPTALGLDAAASVRPAGPPGTFYIWDSGAREISVEITTKSVEVDTQRKVDQFLEENGIRSDTNAASFVYYLNPDLPSLGDIPRGTTIELPVLRIPSSERTLPKQPIVAVVVDPQLKESLRGDVDGFRSTVMKEQKKLDPNVASDLKFINEALDQFYKDTVPSSHEMLEQIRQDVAALQAIFARSSKHKHTLSSEALKQLSLIKADLQDKLDAVRQGNPDVDVNVRTLREGNEVSHFIVCYAPEALYKENQCDLSFSRESSPTGQPLAIATYMFWASKPGNGS